MNNSPFTTIDINLVSYLKVKGYPVETTKQDKKLVEFCFSPEIKSLADKWQFNPDEEMKLVQDFIDEKSRILAFIKSSPGGLK